MGDNLGTCASRVYYVKIEEKNMPRLAYLRRPHPQLTTKWSVRRFLKDLKIRYFKGFGVINDCIIFSTFL